VSRRTMLAGRFRRSIVGRVRRQSSRKTAAHREVSQRARTWMMVDVVAVVGVACREAEVALSPCWDWK
jgi:hypothetical protein